MSSSILLAANAELTNGEGVGDYTLCHSNASNILPFPIPAEPFKIGGTGGASGVSSVFGCAGDELDGRSFGTYMIQIRSAK